MVLKHSIDYKTTTIQIEFFIHKESALGSWFKNIFEVGQGYLLVHQKSKSVFL